MHEPVEITTIEAHTAGEPLRIITGGWPSLPGETMVARRAYAREQQDELRRMLMLEPRGHADMYGALLTPPASPDGDVGVLFMHNAGWSTMCGHGILAMVAVGLDHGLYEVRDPNAIQIDTPAGRVVARAERESGRVARVEFDNVPSFVGEQVETTLDHPLYQGRVSATIAFGGAFYAYVDAASLGLELGAADHERVVSLGRAIKAALADPALVRHPLGETELEFLYGVIFVGPPHDASHHSRNVCVFADGEVDRSPTGTGVSGRVAIHHARDELALGEWIEIESILGTCFGARVLRTCEFGGRPAIVPQVRGMAYATGRATYTLDPRDPLGRGFMLR